MTRRPTASELVEGPRARRLCAAAALLQDQRLYAPTMGVVDPADDHLVAEVAAALLSIDLSALRTSSDPLTLAHQVGDTVVVARYWQEPDENDLLLARPELREPLARVAEAILAAPGTAWWSTPADLAVQREVSFVTPYSAPPAALTGLRERLDRWRREEAALDRRHRAQLVEDVRTSNRSSWWWSTPDGAGLPGTTRAVDGLAACRLLWAEEEGGDFDDADVRPLRPASPPRVYEVDDAAAWVELVERHPLEVTESRRFDWYRVTGLDTRWWIPDWRAVAESYDAVHVTVTAYLATATRAWDLDRSRVGGGTDHCATVMAHWSPDETVWFTDVLAEAGSVERWHDDGPPEPGTLTSPSGWRRG